jgi:primosomal protein N' (replication factor Y)
LLVSAAKNVDIQAYMRAWLARVKASASVRITIDIDPMSFF